MSTDKPDCQNSSMRLSGHVIPGCVKLTIKAKRHTHQTSQVSDIIHWRVLIVYIFDYMASLELQLTATPKIPRVHCPMYQPIRKKSKF